MVTHIDPEKVYQEIKEDLQEDRKALFLGEESLIHALYTSGKSKEEGKAIETKAIVPKSSEVRTEDEAIKKSREKDILRKGTPNTTYKLSEVSDGDEKYSTVIDVGKNPLPNIKKALKKAEEEAVLVMLLPKKYIYPVKVSFKKLFRKKEKLISTEELLKQRDLSIKLYKVLKDKEETKLLVKYKEKNYREKYSEIKFPEMKELTQKVVKESKPEIMKAEPGNSFCIESKDKNYLYHYTEIKRNKKGPTKFTINFLNRKEEHVEKEKRRNKKFTVEVKPNLEKFREKIKKQDLIIPKKRIIDYYA